MAQAVEDWYKQMPIITRSYLTAAVVTTVGCSLEVLYASSFSGIDLIPCLRECGLTWILYLLMIDLESLLRECRLIDMDVFRIMFLSCWKIEAWFLLSIISPYNLYLNPTLVVKQYQFWRLVTNFLYFRNMDLDFLFHMFFLARYCKLLEENSFRGKTADFLYMLLFGATVLTGIVLIGGMIPYLSVSFSKIIFLSNSLTFMMVYVWSKQNPYIHMSFLGLFTFTAAYLPWVLLGFSVLVGASPWGDLLGMIAGHAYYFLAFVYPRMTDRRPLKTPSFLKALFADEPVIVARPEDVRFAHAPFDEIHQD
ncbi:hypothetical protein IGI04_001189 [Brassica rapa subsp. trilocularis]|uniref:Derlin n=1 Tax=Brassica rapa subsp. trilocularis TaxID=1813537 RepID=A0ABQ7NRY5_BRACM|nr:hypothetical protein IGI04_001189 [Brassica rapa subsp. trilocularis]